MKYLHITLRIWRLRVPNTPCYWILCINKSAVLISGTKWYKNSLFSEYIISKMINEITFKKRQDTFWIFQRKPLSDDLHLHCLYAKHIFCQNWAIGAWKIRCLSSDLLKERFWLVSVTSLNIHEWHVWNQHLLLFTSILTVQLKVSESVCLLYSRHWVCGWPIGA